MQAELDRQKEKCAAMKKERDDARAELAAQESLSAATLEQLARVTEQAHALTKRVDELDRTLTEIQTVCVGYGREPKRGRIEDVIDLRTQRDALHARAQAAELRVEQLERELATEYAARGQEIRRHEQSERSHRDAMQFVWTRLKAELPSGRLQGVLNETIDLARKALVTTPAKGEAGACNHAVTRPALPPNRQCVACSAVLAPAKGEEPKRCDECHGLVRCLRDCSKAAGVTR